MKRLLPLLVLSLFACKDKEVPSVSESNKPLLLQIHTPEFELFQPKEVGHHVKIKATDFKFYLTDICYYKSNGDSVVIRDAFLYDKDAKQDTCWLTIPNDAVAFSFGIGVPAHANKQDPTLYPNTHPYSIKGSNGMHWTWNSGYKFIMLEGKRDTSASGNFLDSFSYHTGTDSLYTRLKYPITERSLLLGFDIWVDVPKLFQNIDLNAEPETMGGNELAQRFTNNFVSALVLYYSGRP